MINSQIRCCYCGLKCTNVPHKRILLFSFDLAGQFMSHSQYFFVLSLPFLFSIFFSDPQRFFPNPSWSVFTIMYGRRVCPNIMGTVLISVGANVMSMFPVASAGAHLLAFLSEAFYNIFNFELHRVEIWKCLWSCDAIDGNTKPRSLHHVAIVISWTIVPCNSVRDPRQRMDIWCMM